MNKDVCTEGHFFGDITQSPFGAQERAETAVRDAEAARTAWTCRVCLTNEVDTIVVPCGHVLCQRCSSAVTRCPFCRHQVTKSQRIYRP